MKRMAVKWYLVLLLAGFACIPLVSAATIDLSPHQVAPGGQITVTTTGLKDGEILTMKLIATLNRPGQSYKMEVRNLDFPINLDDASFEITNHNTFSNTVNIVNYIPSVGQTIITTGGKSVNNLWSTGISGEGRDDINGTFSLIRIAGLTKYGGAAQITSIMEWSGIKQASEDFIPPMENGGPEDFTFTFTQNGIKSGSIELLILSNETVVSADKVIIGTTVLVPYSSSAFAAYVENNHPYSFASSVQGTSKGQQVIGLPGPTGPGPGPTSGNSHSWFTADDIASYTGKYAHLK